MGFHGLDLLVILLIVLLIFGARRLPELGATLGKSFQALQKGLNDQEEQETVEEDGNSKDEKRAL
jgi:sec-independent protein translocase protein TatA